MTHAKPAARRCAVYTRKSSEEGLEQDFNSLHAQREACEAFIRSQAGEGWKLVKDPYDDGGLSGGTMERPALQRLMADITAGKIDTVVVYKVDRLTRSLADFAKIVELFDGANVSFVAVTQQFNTTSSMGRLTLNILLSFAQFEREVTGERIRDKIAASKQKGMWMGGRVALGYDVKDRKLVVNETEANTIRHIFQRYLKLGCVRFLKAELAADGIVSKLRLLKSGETAGGAGFSRGALYALLSNPIYIGQTRHKHVSHPGQHQAIIDEGLWEAVQQQLKHNTVKRRDHRTRTGNGFLTGKLFDDHGRRMTPTYAKKQNRQYRYYISQGTISGKLAGDNSVEGKDDSASEAAGIQKANPNPSSHGNQTITPTRKVTSAAAVWRIPARELERVVTQETVQLLGNQHRLMAILAEAGTDTNHLPEILRSAAQLHAHLTSSAATDGPAKLLSESIVRIDVRFDRLVITIDLPALLRANGSNASVATSQPSMSRLSWPVPMQFRRRGQEARLVISSGASRAKPLRRGSDRFEGNEIPTAIDHTLIKAIARARAWFAELKSGAETSMEDIAKRESVTQRYLARLLPLAFLSPDIVQAVAEGRQPVEMTIASITRGRPLPLAWASQHKTLGFSISQPR